MRTNRAAVTGLAARRLGSRDDGEDAVQEACMRFARAIPNFDVAYQVSTLYHKILTNVCLDMLRTRERRDWDTSLDAYLYEDRNGKVADREASVTSLYSQQKDISGVDIEGSRRIQGTVAMFGKMDRQLIIMAFVEGYSHIEIAIRTNIPYGKVKARMRRLRATFKIYYDLQPIIESMGRDNGRSV